MLDLFSLNIPSQKTQTHGLATINFSTNQRLLWSTWPGCTWWSWQEETIWRRKKSGRTVDGILLVGGNSSPQLLRVWTPECLGSSWGDGNSNHICFIFIPKIWGRFSHIDDFFSIGGGCRWRKPPSRIDSAAVEVGTLSQVYRVTSQVVHDFLPTV